MRRLRAVIIGAGGIGRHHAKWYDRLGCAVVGFSVTSPTRLAYRRAAMVAEGVEPGVGSTDWASLLDDLRPDLISVCAPAEAHFEPTRGCLERGLPVLCEKPLVWSADLAKASAQAAELVELSRARATLLAVNLQYTYAAEAYRQWLTPTAPSRCEAVLESRGKAAERTAGEVWMELGPHALSLIFGLLPGGVIRPDTLRVEGAAQRAEAWFEIDLAGRSVACHVRCGQRREGDLERRFGLDDALVDLAGRNDEQGEYAAYLSLAGAERKYPDWLRTSLERFVERVAGRPAEVVEARAAVANLEAQRQVAERLTGKVE